MKLLDSALLSLKENFFPNFLDAEEKFDLDRAYLEWDLEDIRTDCVHPLEATKITFMTLFYLSRLIKLGSLTGANQAIKEQLQALKKDLMGLFTLKPESHKSLRSINILDEMEKLTTRLESEAREKFNDHPPELESETENRPTNKLEITPAALEIVNIIAPCTSITNIITIGKLLSELNKPLENNNKLNFSQKIFKIAGHAGKVLSEFTPLPAVGKFFSNAAVITGSFLGIIDKQNAA